MGVTTYVVYAPTIIAALVGLAALVAGVVIAVRSRDDGGYDIDVRG